MVWGLPVAFFALGLLGHALARPGTARTALVPLSGLFLALLGGAEAVFLAAAVGRYDEGRDLAALVGTARQPSSMRAFLIFTPPAVPGPLPGMVGFASLNGLDAGNRLGHGLLTRVEGRNVPGTELGMFMLNSCTFAVSGQLPC